MVSEQLRLFKDALLRKHEEQESKLAQIFDLMLERSQAGGVGASFKDMRDEEAWLAFKPAREPAPAEVPREVQGLERIGQELGRLQQHVALQLALISREVVRERAARAKDPVACLCACAPRTAAILDGRGHRAARPLPLEEQSSLGRVEPRISDARVGDGEEHARSGDFPAAGGHGRTEAADRRDGSGGSSAAGLPQSEHAWQKGLSSRERACTTPYQHLSRLFGPAE